MVDDQARSEAMRTSRRTPRGLLGIAVAASLLWSTAAQAEYGTRELPIIDGRLATSSDILATVAIVDPDDGESVCSGTLIAPRVVVTAAHCVVEEDDDTGEILAYFGAEDVLVVAGVLDVYDATESHVYSAVRVEAHPDYPNLYASFTHPSGAGRLDDIAIIVLDRPVAGLMTAVVPTVEQARLALVPGAMVTVSGYGLTDPEGDESGLLYIAETPFRHLAEAEFVLGGAGHPDTCQGDSGGPVYLRSGGVLALIGATSRGSEDVDDVCGGGGIYAFAPFYRDWFAQASGGAYAPGPGVDLTAPGPPGGGGGGHVDDEYDDDDGCAAAGSSGPWAPLMAALLGAWLIWRRRVPERV